MRNPTRKTRRLLAWLIKQESADPQALAAAAADEYGVPLIDANAFDLTQAPISLVSESLIEKHQALPLHLRGNQLFIGMKDPTDHEVIDEIAFSSGFHVEPILVAANQLQSGHRTGHGGDQPRVSMISTRKKDSRTSHSMPRPRNSTTRPPTSVSTKHPVVRFINKVLLDAIRKGASDIHFEPYETRYRIRYRLDGVLKNVAGPPIQMSRRLSSRLKVMAGSGHRRAARSAGRTHQTQPVAAPRVSTSA